uniref:Uncharacterized protein n=1 Tax=Oryza rufipogon TaxID=4529 RepID=A0A0E0QPQ3_ORYRU
MTRGSGGAWRPRRGSLSAAAASRLLRVEGHDRRGRAVDAAGNSSRCRVPTLIYPRRGGDRDDSLDFSPSGRRSPVTISANANEATSHGDRKIGNACGCCESSWQYYKKVNCETCFFFFCISRNF